MISNPPNSSVYVNLWAKHFNNKSDIYRFNFIDNLSFVKRKNIPLYTNVGKKMALGIYYSNPKKNYNDYRGKVFLVYHVPEYFNVEDISSNEIGKLAINDSLGYLLDLKKFDSFDDYASAYLKKSDYKNYKRRLKKLTLDHNITFEKIKGSIEKEKYEEYFTAFEKMLRVRYATKQQHFRSLSGNLWPFYKELFFELINANLASIFLVLDNGKPISISLNYHSGNVFIAVMSVFNISYSKYGLGTIRVMQQIKDCFENNFSILDFRMGSYGYKEKWCNVSYPIEHHILYDKKSFVSSSIAFGLKGYFKAKEIGRKTGVNRKLAKLALKQKPPSQI